MHIFGKGEGIKKKSILAEILRALPKPTEVEKRKRQRRLYIRRCDTFIISNRRLQKLLPIEGMRTYVCFNYWRQCNKGKV